MFKYITFLFILVASMAIAQEDDPLLLPCDSDTDCYRIGEFPTTEFSISKKFESAATVAVYQAPLLADVNGDCIPELLVASTSDGLTNPRITRNIRVVSTLDGSTMFGIPTAFFGWSGPTSFAVADIDGSGSPVVIVAAAGTAQNPINVRQRLVCYEMDGTVRWIANSQFGTSQEFGFGPSVGIADFNGDGIPEVYILNEIYNAQTGVKLADGGNNGVAQGDETYLIGTNAAPIAAQLDDNPNDLELAAGYTIYKVNITNTNGLAGNTMTPHNISVNGQFRDGFTSVGDITGDGNLDVVVTSRGANNGLLYVYSFLDQTPELVAQVNPPNGGGPLNYKIGPAFIGDMDGNGQVSIGICRSYRLYAYSYNGTTELQQKWVLTTNDQSGETGLTMFDFNQDGIQEIVYRDETTLRILNGFGNAVQTLASFNCSSGTGVEYPIVGDIDGSGQSKICVTCGSVLAGRVEVFETGNQMQPWAPSRSTWNQYSYHILNINEDLTVPEQQLSNATYGGGLFNSFFAQAPKISSEKLYLIPLADLALEIDCAEMNLENETYSAQLQIHNLPTATGAFNDELTINVFSGTSDNPGELIDSFTVDISLLPGQSMSDLNWAISLSEISDVDAFFFVINYSGTAFNLNLFDELYDVEECDYNNNVEQAHLIPLVEYVTAGLCEGSTFNFFGESITEPGTYTNVQQNQSGCDSLITILTIDEGGFFDSQNIIACGSYYWELNETTYFESGTYQVVSTDENDCEETFEIVLTIGTSAESTSFVQACDQFLWTANDSLISSSGTYQTLLSTALGCDSVVTLDIEISESAIETFHVESCGSYTWYGNSISDSGDYTQNFVATNGCDSLEILNLTIHPEYDIAEVILACNSFEINGDVLVEPGMYTYSFISQFGCDSTYSINLQLSYDEFSFQEATICQGSNFVLPDGSVVTDEDTYTSIIPTASQCDSVITTALTVIPIVETTQNIRICDNDFFTLPGGSQVSPPGVYTATFNSILTGCDSIVTFTIAADPSPSVAFLWDPSPVPIDDAVIHTVNLSNHELDFEWFYNGSSISNTFEPTLNLMGSNPEMENQLCLQGVNYLGCQSTFCTTIRFVVPLMVYCPNAFTPNNDGINDVFKPVVTGYSDGGYLFRIFNRWGEKIFETSDPAEAWLGNHQRGDYYVPDGIYVWSLEVKAQTTAEVQVYTGHVSLIR